MVSESDMLRVQAGGDWGKIISFRLVITATTRGICTQDPENELQPPASPLTSDDPPLSTLLHSHSYIHIRKAIHNVSVSRSGNLAALGNAEEKELVDLPASATGTVTRSAQSTDSRSAWNEAASSQAEAP